jgi:4-hydroxybenzoate polyprenyltransferase
MNGSKLKIWISALRIHQWAKNILIFIPLLLSHNFMELELIISSVMAFFSFSLVASANYLFNDLIDLDFDKHHPTKRNRPLASGRLPVYHGWLAILLLLGISFIIISYLPFLFFVSVVIYLLVSILYSTVLKRLIIVDIIILAGLYTIRIASGGFAVEVTATFWLLAFSMFLFFSLAIVKRVSELELFKSSNFKFDNNGWLHGRCYQLEDLPILNSLGSGAGLLSVLIFALYINSLEIKALYKTPEILWFILPVFLYWISRIWLLASKGLVNEDPVVFALHDRASLLISIILIVFLWLATL